MGIKGKVPPSLSRQSIDPFPWPLKTEFSQMTAQIGLSCWPLNVVWASTPLEDSKSSQEDNALKQPCLCLAKPHAKAE
jgi:hypothetical protein